LQSPTFWFKTNPLQHPKIASLPSRGIDMRTNSRFARIGLLLLALLPAGCRVSDEAPLGKATLSIDADASLLQRDSIVVILKASSGADTLFQGKLSGLDTLLHLPASGYDGGRALIIIQGFQGGQLVYEERRDYNGDTQKNLIVDVPLDLTGSIPRTSLDLRPDRIKLFLGGPAKPMQAYPPEAWKDKVLAWTTGDSAVATVSQTGEVTPKGLGVTYVRATSGDTASDASSITVVRDPPVLDFGSDTTLAVGTAVTLHVSVKQEYGDVAEFAWDFEGDGTYEGTVAGVPGQADFAIPARTYSQTGDFVVHVRVRDGEGNVAFATKKIKVGATAPSLDSLSASPSIVSIKDAVSFKALASGGGAALKTFSWDFDGDGKADQSGNLQGDTATLTGVFNYPDAKTYLAQLRITDSEGGFVAASAQVTVKLDRPSANAGVDFSVAVGAQVRLQGRGMDTLGRIVKQEWKIGADDFAPATDSGALAFTAPVIPGNVACVFRVTDDDGLAAEDIVIVTINDGKEPSIASFLPHDTVITIKDEVSFAAQAGAVDADLKSWTLDVNGDGNPEAQGDLSGRSQPIRTKRIFPAAGTFDVTLKILDLNGKSAVANARVTVLLDAPMADAGPDTSNVAPGSRVNLHGRAKDSLGAIVRMEWKIGSGTYAVVSKGDTSITAPATAGAYSCVFQVMDDDSLVDSDAMIVNVMASVNAELANLALSAGLLAPGFAPGTAAYTASVSNATDSIKVTPTAGEGSTIKVNTKTVASGTASGNIPLNVGPNTITIDVTAQDGTTKKSYTVSVTRSASANADLSNLGLSVGLLAPGFSPGTTNYSASVSNATDSIKVTPTAGTAGATLKVNNAAVASASASKSIGLNVGPNTITVEVTAPDGVAKNTYTVTVTRAASAIADLSNLGITPGALNPSFVSGTLAYTASVPNATDSVKLTPTVAGTGATVKVNNITVASGSASGSIFVPVGNTSIAVVVTAQDGTTKKTYTVTVTRLPNANADLLNLATTPGPASPAFAPATIGYTLTVPYSSTSISVTATVAASTSTLKVKTAAATSGTAVSVNLTVGANSIPVEVTAQDGTTKKTYTLAVTRTAASTNARLSALAVPTGVTIDPSFSPTVTDYDATATASVAALTLQPTAADANATITVDGTAVASGSKSANLAFLYGTSSHTIVVTAQDGVTKQTYNFTIWRPGSADFITGYAWVNDYSASHQLTTDTYNPGGIVNFTKTAAGKYTVTFRGLGTLGNSQGIVHATAYGGFPTFCKVVSSSNSGGDLAANIACFTTSGAVSDSKVSVIAQFPRSSATGLNAYALADAPTTDSYSPSAARSYNSNGAGGSILITRASAGSYHVIMRGMDLGINESGNPIVTAYGAGNIHCVSGGWGLSDGDADIRVSCLDPATGDRVDAPFNISYAQIVSGSAFGAGAAQIIGDLADADDPFGFNTGGGAIKVDNTSTGFYRITFTGLAAQGGTRPGNVQLTTSQFGGSNNTCTVQGWSRSTSDFVVDASCWDNAGDATSNIFTIQVLK
jgi:hypothetical protein